MAIGSSNQITATNNIKKVAINTTGTKKLIALAIIIELIYYCANSRTVFPNSFTNCKSCLSFLGSRSPWGAYMYVTNWLKQQSKEPLKYPKELVKSVFDNNQKVGKTYLISETNIVPTSVITSYLWITLDP